MIRPISLFAAAMLALALVSAPAAATHNNAGTLKVHDDENTTPVKRNVPHVDCDFWVEGFGMSDDSGTLVFFSWPPTGDKNVVTPGGNGSLDWTADSGTTSGEYHFLAGPFTLPSGHYRVEASTDDGHPGSNAGHFAKTKTFWVTCEPTPPAPTPCPPTLIATALTGAEVSLTWGAVLDADAYLVYRATGEGDYELVAELDGQTLAYLDDDVEAGLVYHYTVTAVVDGVPSVDCDEASVTAIPFFPTWTVGALALAASVGGFVMLRRRF